MASLTEVVLTVDEWEALRLADYEGLYHDTAAREMNVSRPTFGRIKIPCEILLKVRSIQPLLFFLHTENT